MLTSRTNSPSLHGSAVLSQEELGRARRCYSACRMRARLTLAPGGTIRLAVCQAESSMREMRVATSVIHALNSPEGARARRDDNGRHCHQRSAGLTDQM